MNGREERLQILKMLSEGKVTAEQAEQLLAAIQAEDAGGKGEPARPEEPPRADAPPYPDLPASTRGRGRQVRVIVRDGDGNDATRVNVSVPLPLIRSIGRFLPRGMMKGKVSGLGEGDVDIDMDAILEAVEAGAEGKVVEIRDGASRRIEVWVENG